MLNIKRLNQIEKSFPNKKIAVIGDMMLDGYYWGNVTRISPEAPVPVVSIDNEFYRFGGAANVAANIQKLGALPFPIGIIGNDNDGKMFKSLLKKFNIHSDGIFVDRKRKTTVKTRVVAGTQHIVRIDKESNNYMPPSISAKIISLLENNISGLDAIILQDYNKGVFTQELIENIIEIANKNNKIITVDPKFINFKHYKNVTLIKPNKKEAEDVLGIRIETDKDIKKAGIELLNMLNTKYVLLTLGENGIALFEKGKNEIRIPTKARKVADVSGAGDTVISTLTLALCAGSKIAEAAYISNYAAGLVCEEVGIVPIEKERLFKAVKDSF